MYDRCSVDLVRRMVEACGSQLTVLDLHLADDWFFVAEVGLQGAVGLLFVLVMCVIVYFSVSVVHFCCYSCLSMNLVFFSLQHF